MIAFFANIFGYVLNLIYSIVGNYGWSIIIFCVLIKLLLLPLSIKQQRTMLKTNKIQGKMKELQFRYKNDPEKLNQETMLLYKNEKMSPFSGCFSAIIQLVLLISVFYLVRMPLTYMKKINTDVIEKYYKVMEENDLTTSKNAYGEIEIIREIGNIRNLKNTEKENVEEKLENENTILEENNNADVNVEETNIAENNTETTNTETQVQENEKLEIKDDELDDMYINMEFLGLDLSQIPTQSLNNWKVYIIPALYVIMSFISMRVTTKQQTNKSQNIVVDKENNDEKSLTTKEEDPMEALNKANSSMSFIFPVMYLSVALIAPLGLALYWLVNSVCMIIERLLLNKFIKQEEE